MAQNDKFYTKYEVAKDCVSFLSKYADITNECFAMEHVSYN